MRLTQHNHVAIYFILKPLCYLLLNIKRFLIGHVPPSRQYPAFTICATLAAAKQHANENSDLMSSLNSFF